MVIGLSEKTLKEISEGRGGVPDPVNFENFIREVHHEIIDKYFSENSNFLISLGVNFVDFGIVNEIGKCHRKVALQDRAGDIRSLGALLRVIDELDVGPSRAPSASFINNRHEMDPVSKWHWFKHTITDEWALNHNVEFRNGVSFPRVVFSVTVRPTRPESIGYWISQVARPINKVLTTDEAQSIILEQFGIKIEIERGDIKSAASSIGGVWADLEEEVLTQGRKVIMVVDDDAERIEDAFFALMDDYHLKFLPSITAAFQFLDSAKVTAVVVDLQMPTEGKWSKEDSEESRMTGFRFLDDVRSNYKEVKTCVLTGSRHPVSKEAQKSVDLFLRKPIDPRRLRDEIVALVETAKE
jgi:Response regulator containing CheY-like receiver, AAA-type ATPase, and DNA-binding domains